MNSMFSLFDAFAAEQILGKFFQTSTSVPPSFTPNHGGAAASDSLKSPQQPSKKSDKSKCSNPMRPRFALEFDGINCFETIVPN